MSIVSGRRSVRPDGGVYRSMRLRRRTRGAFRRQRPVLFLALVLCAVAAMGIGIVFGVWYAFFR